MEITGCTPEEFFALVCAQVSWTHDSYLTSGGRCVLRMTTAVPVGFQRDEGGRIVAVAVQNGGHVVFDDGIRTARVPRPGR